MFTIHQVEEMTDPYSALNRVKDQVRQVRRTIRTLSNPPFGKAKQPTLLERHKYPSPVFDYDCGSSRCLDKRALIVYVASGYYKTPEELLQATHSHEAQSIEIAKAFNRLGYLVDIVDVHDSSTNPSRKYDVLFGEHHNYARLMSCVRENGLKIFYGTRSYWAAEQQAIEFRALRVQQTRGVNLPVFHWEPPNAWVEASNAVVAIGNDVTTDTFRAHHQHVFGLDNSALPVPIPDIANKNFTEARKNFLWLGNRTLLRKGLDLVLEAFAGLKDYHLWVCGPLHDQQERGFIRAYRRELFHMPNIHPIGFVAPQSQMLQNLISHCAATVFTSCSEGMCGGILDCMAYGLVPIVTREVGMDTEDFGLTIATGSVETIRAAVVEFSGMSPEQCRIMAEKASKRIYDRYNISAFGQNIENILRTITTKC